MSILNGNFVLKGKNNNEIVFTRPYLNNKRELMFLSCSAFHYPNLSFIVNEVDKTIEITSKEKQKVSISLKGVNEEFLKLAMDAKKEILNMLRKYTSDLESGNEKIYVFETNVERCHYYFASDTLLENGQYSIKFEGGLVYFLNLAGKKLKDFDELQAKLSGKFNKMKKDSYRVQKGNEVYYEMTFKELQKIA